MTDQTNSVTTDIINEAKKKPVKKTAKTNEEITVVVEKKKKEKAETLLIIFESGVSYTTGSGITFTQQEKMKEILLEEAEYLLKLDNFKLPNDEEKEMYYNNLEV